MIVLGTGATLKRGTLPVNAPSKPPRTGSFRRHHTIDRDEATSEDVKKSGNGPLPSEPVSEPSMATVTTATADANKVRVETEVKDSKSSVDKEGGKRTGVPEVQFTDSLNPVPQTVVNGVINTSNQNAENSLPVMRGLHIVEKSLPVVPNVSSGTVENSLPVVPDVGESQLTLPVATESSHQDQGKDIGSEPSSPSRNHEEIQNSNGPAETQHQDKKQSTKEKETAACHPMTTTALTQDLTEKATTSDKTSVSNSDSKPEQSEPQSDTSAVEGQRSSQRDSFSMGRTYRAEDSLFETAMLLGKFSTDLCRW